MTPLVKSYANKKIIKLFKRPQLGQMFALRLVEERGVVFLLSA